MFELKTHKKFDKDFQRDLYCGTYNNTDFEELSKIIKALLAGSVLDAKYKDHNLKGNLKIFRECHIKPDWLLVYKIDLDANTLNLARLGTHNQIFNQ
jgi:mRNA interferase YafQ